MSSPFYHNRAKSVQHVMHGGNCTILGFDISDTDLGAHGFTSLVLSLAAMVSSTTLEVVQQALATVSTQKIRTWCQQTLGQSVQGKRKKALLAAVKREQKWDQFRAVG